MVQPLAGCAKQEPRLDKRSLPVHEAASGESGLTRILKVQDDLIKRLGGVDKVAELTGRRKRMVYDPDTNSYHYRARFDKVPMDQVLRLNLD